MARLDPGHHWSTGRDDHGGRSPDPCPLGHDVSPRSILKGPP
jgi:hypothetical protein